MLRYEFVQEPTSAQLTGYGGLLPYLDLACVLGVLEAVDEKVGVCGEQGWRDRQHVLALMLLNLVGGECVEDIRLLEADAGLCRMVREAERWGLSRRQRRELGKRFRRGRDRTFPSPTRLYEYLNEFHDPAQEEQRVEGRAFIPAQDAHLKGLCAVNQALVASQEDLEAIRAELPTDAANYHERYATRIGHPGDPEK